MNIFRFFCTGANKLSDGKIKMAGFVSSPFSHFRCWIGQYFATWFLISADHSVNERESDSRWGDEPSNPIFSSRVYTHSLYIKIWLYRVTPQEILGTLKSFPGWLVETNCIENRRILWCPVPRFPPKHDPLGISALSSHIIWVTYQESGGSGHFVRITHTVWVIPLYSFCNIDE